MLVLTRKPGERIVIARDIVVTVLEVTGRAIRLGIEAPRQVPVLRGELTKPGVLRPRRVPSGSA
jgi:carbon storage regulator